MKSQIQKVVVIISVIILASCATSENAEFTSLPLGEVIYEPVDNNNFSEHLIFYATNRNPSLRVGEYFGKERNTMSFGKLLISVPKQREPGTLRVSNRRYPNLTRYFSIRTNSKIPKEQFIQEITRGTDDSLIYIHGYKNSFSDAAYRTAQIKEDLDFSGKVILFSWPSRNGLFQYTVDETNAKWSVPAFSNLLKKISNAKKSGNVYIIAHSMGTRFIASMIKEIKCSGNNTNIKDIILAAPDIDADIFKNEIAPLLSTASSRVTVYTSESDSALPQSETLHGNIRAGQYASKVANKYLQTIDASGIDTSMVGVNHSYYAESKKLLKDIKHIFNDDPISERNIYKTTNYWRLK